MTRLLLIAAVIALIAVAIGGLAGRFAPDIAEAGRNAAAAEDAGSASSDAPSAVVVQAGEVAVRRADDSHFYTDADIDGTTIRMIIDSGASSVVLTRADAEAAGVDVDALPIGGSAQTAGGTVPVRPLTLERVSVGDIVVRAVPAVVIETEMPASLLGQSFLRKLEVVSVEGDVMTLR